MWQSKLLAHMETWRPYTSLYVGLLALSAATLWQGHALSLPVALLIFVAPTLGWIAGLYGCDYFDRDLDKLQKGHRPLPSGRISEREGFVCMMVSMYLGFAASAWLSFTNLLLAGLVMATAVGYTIVKAHAFLGNISRGIPGGLTALFGIVAAAGGNFPLVHLNLVLLLPVLFLLHDMTTNLIGAMRDVKGDRAGNCITFPVKYGLRAAVRLAIGLTSAWEAIAVLLPVLTPMHVVDFYLVYSLALSLAILGFFRLTRRPEDQETALFAHKCFVLERMLLAGALLAGSLGILSAVVIVLPLTAFTLWSQIKMRNRHEFGLTSR